jgi:hypothetical protein
MDFDGIVEVLRRVVPEYAPNRPDAGHIARASNS